MIKHTPGPWRVIDHYVTAGEEQVCAVGVDWTANNVTANARLIAAAPELLEALQSVLASVPFSQYHGDGELEECEHRVRAAIAKATGQA